MLVVNDHSRIYISVVVRGGWGQKPPRKVDKDIFLLRNLAGARNDSFCSASCIKVYAKMATANNNHWLHWP